MKKTLLMTTALVALAVSGNAYADVTINSDTVLEDHYTDNVIISGGNNTINQDVSVDSYLNYDAGKNITVNGGTTTMEGKSLNAWAGSITMTDGTLNLNNGDDDSSSTLWAAKDINISGGIINMNGDDTGIDTFYDLTDETGAPIEKPQAAGNINITGGTINVNGHSASLGSVVGMFLTGFDAPALNTLFVDKNLRYHGLIQAYSRTNRIYDSTKSFGNIVTFRNLEQATIDAIKCFGKENDNNLILEKSYKEYMDGFEDILTGKYHRGYVDIVNELQAKYPTPDEIVKEKDKKDFSKLFGEYLRIENILQNYDEFTNLKELQTIDTENIKALEEFKNKYYVSDEQIQDMQKITVLPERAIQDYKSTYNDICDWQRQQRVNKETEKSNIDWSDVVFEVDLLKSQEINLDYILELIFDKNKNTKNKDKQRLFYILILLSIICKS